MVHHYIYNSLHHISFDEPTNLPDESANAAAIVPVLRRRACFLGTLPIGASLRGALLSRTAAHHRYFTPAAYWNRDATILTGGRA